MNKRRKLALSLMILGVVLLAGAVSLFLYNRWDENRASAAAFSTARALTTLIAEQAPAPSGAPDPDDADAQEDSRPPSVLYEGRSYIGIVSIPTLDLSLPVMETWSYEKLKVSPCRYTGDPRDDDLVIMAHNYTQHFGSISLLRHGDPVTFVDAAGTEHRYTVAAIETVNSNDIAGMVETEYDLTLFTCTYGGQARTAVRCFRL